MSIISFNSTSDLTKFSAQALVELAENAIKKQGRFLVALSGGSTPQKLYERLAGVRMDWRNIHLFWGDERCVPIEHPENSYRQVRLALLDRIEIPEENIHRIPIELEPASAAESYAGTLAKFAEGHLDVPRFDLTLLGLGEDGHTASLFPGSKLEDIRSTLYVSANYQGRPAERITLTPKVFNQARETWFLVTGKNKAPVLRNVLKGKHEPELLPAQRIQPVDGKLIWLVDSEAAKLL